MPTDFHPQQLHVCAKRNLDTLKERQGQRESLDTEQWHATAQDVYVTSRVCEQSFGVALETKCYIEKSPLCAEKSQSIRESQASSPTRAAAARLSAMIHGKDQVYANTMLVDQVSPNHFFFFLSESLFNVNKN